MAGEDDDKHARTEEPTPRKLQKAREKGDVAISRETGTMMTIVSLLLLTVFLMPQVAPPLTGVLARVFEAAGTVQIGEGRAGIRDVGIVTWTLMQGAGIVLAPVLGLFLVAALIGGANLGARVAYDVMY